MWVEISPLHQPRVSHTLCAGQKGLYVVAGIDHIVEEGSDREVILNSVEYYCIRSGCWQVRAPHSALHASRRGIIEIRGRYQARFSPSQPSTDSFSQVLYL